MHFADTALSAGYDQPPISTHASSIADEPEPILPVSTHASSIPAEADAAPAPNYGGRDLITRRVQAGLMPDEALGHWLYSTTCPPKQS